MLKEILEKKSITWFADDAIDAVDELAFQVERSGDKTISKRIYDLSKELNSLWNQTGIGKQEKSQGLKGK